MFQARTDPEKSLCISCLKVKTYQPDLFVNERSGVGKDFGRGDSTISNQYHPVAAMMRCACIALGLAVWFLPSFGETEETLARPPERTLLQERSGIEFQSADTQALQRDDFANPGLLWVDRGQSLWRRAPAADAPGCQHCHGSAASSMAGVATRYPQHHAGADRLINLTQRINQCRIEQQRQPELAYESDDLLALTAFVAHQSKGLPFDVAIDGRAKRHFERGRAYFHQRRGQMNLACHHCHEHYTGRMLRGERLSQGHGNGYPAYRLEWQGLGSLHRRLRFCNQAVRAEPFDYGAPEYLDLELFLAWRAAHLPMEAPSVRR